MTGGMLGLAGSTGVANAASDGGSRKISSSQMPEHSHQLQAGAQGSTAGWDNSGGADRLQYQRLLPGRNIFEFYNRYTTSVGGAGLYSCTHFRLWLEKNCLTSWEVSTNGIC